MRERRFVQVGVLMAVATVLACGAGLPAAAQETYVGASYLAPHGEFNSSVGTFEDDSSGWKIFAGVTVIQRYVGAELTYYDLGDFEDTQGINSFSADVQAWDLAFKAVFPLGAHFEAFAKIGYSYLDVESTVSGPIVSASADASDWELIYGGGVNFKIGEKLGIRAEYEAWDVSGKLDAFSAGLYFRFGPR